MTTRHIRGAAHADAAVGLTERRRARARVAAGATVVRIAEQRAALTIAARGGCRAGARAVGTRLAAGTGRSAAPAIGRIGARDRAALTAAGLARPDATAARARAHLALATARPARPAIGGACREVETSIATAHRARRACPHTLSCRTTEPGSASVAARPAVGGVICHVRARPAARLLAAPAAACVRTCDACIRLRSVGASHVLAANADQRAATARGCEGDEEQQERREQASREGRGAPSRHWENLQRS